MKKVMLLVLAGMIFAGAQTAAAQETENDVMSEQTVINLAVDSAEEVTMGKIYRFGKICDLMPISVTMNSYADSIQDYNESGTGTDRALRSSSDEYMLVDVRAYILNRMKEPLKVAEKIKAVLTYDEDYPFDVSALRMEPLTSNAFVEMRDMNMLIERNVHFIFEVPKTVVMETTAPLYVSFTVDEEQISLSLR